MADGHLALKALGDALKRGFDSVEGRLRQIVAALGSVNRAQESQIKLSKKIVELLTAEPEHSPVADALHELTAEVRALRETMEQRLPPREQGDKKEASP